MGQMDAHAPRPLGAQSRYTHTAYSSPHSPSRRPGPVKIHTQHTLARRLGGPRYCTASGSLRKKPLPSERINHHVSGRVLPEDPLEKEWRRVEEEERARAFEEESARQRALEDARARAAEAKRLEEERLAAPRRYAASLYEQHSSVAPSAVG